MSLGDELRDTLTREAGTRSAPPPDVGRLISGGRARRRRRTLSRVGVAAATVLACASLYAVTADDRQAPRTDQDIAIPPTPIPVDDSRVALAPGSAHRVLVGIDGTGEQVQADFTVEGPGWMGGDYAVVSDATRSTFAGFGVYQPAALAAGRGCEDEGVVSLAGSTPASLAEKLAALPRSTVLVEPEPSEALGRPAVHLRLRIDVDCETYYRVAHSPGGTRGITYDLPDVRARNVIIDFWVLGLVGDAPVVVDLWHSVGAPADIVDRAAAARDSITFVTE